MEFCLRKIEQWEINWTFIRHNFLFIHNLLVSMIPPTHLLMAFILAYFITENWKYRIIMVIGGIIPDIDGIFILFDLNKYYRYHHTLAHPPVIGLILGIFVVSISYLLNEYISNRYGEFKEFGWFFKRLPSRFLQDGFEWSSAYGFFIAGFFVHIFGDIVGTNWPVNLLYPFGEFNVTIASYLSDRIIYGIINPIFDIGCLIIVVILIFFKTNLVFKRRYKD